MSWYPHTTLLYSQHPTGTVSLSVFSAMSGSSNICVDMAFSNETRNQTTTQKYNGKQASNADILFLFGRCIQKRKGVLMRVWVPIAGLGPCIVPLKSRIDL